MPPSSRLNQGVVEAASVAAGATNNQDVELSKKDSLTVQADLTGAANGDLAVTVTPYEADGTTLSAVALPAAASSGPTFVTNRVCFYGRYDVRGIDKVRIGFKNNNAGTQTLTRASWRATGSEE